MLYEGSQEIVEYISQALKQASHEATVLLYSPEIDPFLENPCQVCWYSILFRGRPKGNAKIDGQNMDENDKIKKLCKCFSNMVQDNSYSYNDSKHGNLIETATIIYQ